jgi:Immunity protein 63
MRSEESLSSLTHRFQEMVAALDVEPYYKSFHTTPQHDGSPHIEAKDGRFEYVVTEHGSEFERIGNLSANDALYLLLVGITQHMATTYELRHRVPGIDGRSLWFPYQEGLMESLNPTWGERLKREHLLVLAEYPLRT